MNESDPLANLRDIHLPEPPGAWPPAPGWWLLALLIVLATVALCLWLYRKRRREAWRREALADLPAPGGATTRDISYYSALNQLLKRAARICHPGAGTDRLSGERWQEFLCERAPELPPEELAALARSPYQTEAAISPAKAHELTRNWLRSQQC